MNNTTAASGLDQDAIRFVTMNTEQLDLVTNLVRDEHERLIAGIRANQARNFGRVDPIEYRAACQLLGLLINLNTAKFDGPVG